MFFEDSAILPLWLARTEVPCQNYGSVPVNVLICEYERMTYKPFFFFSGKYLRQKRIDFQLPYDILWQWKHNQVQNKNVTRCQDSIHN